MKLQENCLVWHELYKQEFLLQIPFPVSLLLRQYWPHFPGCFWVGREKSAELAWPWAEPHWPGIKAGHEVHITLMLLPLGGFSGRVSCRCCVFWAVSPRHLVHLPLSLMLECGFNRQKLSFCVFSISFLWILTSRLCIRGGQGDSLIVAKATRKPYWKRKVWKYEIVSSVYGNRKVILEKTKYIINWF